MREILTYPAPILAQKCRPISEEEFKRGMVDGVSLNLILDDMMTILASSKGVGLAAPQVGIPIRLFLLDLRDGQLPRAFFNPKLECFGTPQLGDEGCLSLPGIFVKVKRKPACIVTSQAQDGKTFTLKMEGLSARASQHEEDHLNGFLAINRIGMAAKMMVRKKLEAMEKGYRSWQQHLKEKEAKEKKDSLAPENEQPSPSA